MKAWSAALSTELAGLPQVTARTFFGLTALYRRNTIFALLPRTRALETPNSLAFKLESTRRRIRTRLQHDPRVAATEMQKARWFRFELITGTDFGDALDGLGHAYEAAGKGKTAGLSSRKDPSTCDRDRIPVYLTSNERSNQRQPCGTYGESVNSSTSFYAAASCRARTGYAL